MLQCRLIVDSPLDGAWNMAVDEALLDGAADGGVATLRFYRWREPTLSLGYFQAYAEREAHAASRDAAAVRRLSGGGALVHDRELTYSLCLPASHLTGRQPAELYGIVHRALIAVLAPWGIRATLNCEACPGGLTASEAEEPFLCFARRTGADIVLHPSRSGQQPVKIVGSAQRRRRGAVLQHGGLLLAASPGAPELRGVQEVAGQALEPGPVATAWSAGIAQALGLELRATTLGAKLQNAARRLVEEKYRSAAWNRRR